MARSIECQCEQRFTCRHCLQNARPYYFTLPNGSVIISPSPSALRRLISQSAPKK